MSPPPPPRLPLPPVVKKSDGSSVGGGGNNEHGGNILQSSMARMNLEKMAHNPPAVGVPEIAPAATVIPNGIGGGDNDRMMNQPPPPRAPPPPPTTPMTMNRFANRHQQQQQQFAPPPSHHHHRTGPPPPQPPTFSQQQQQQHHSNIKYSAPINQQHHGGGVAMSLQPPPPPPPPMMQSNQYIRQQPIQQQQQQFQQFSNAMQPPLQPPPPPYHQNQQQPPPPSSFSMRPPQPQYNTTTTNYPTPTTTVSTPHNYPSSNHHTTTPKIDPSQIPRIPLFTRPHHAPATIYPSCTTNNPNYNTNFGSSSSSSGTGGSSSVGPPPPLDSRYVFNPRLGGINTSYNTMSNNYHNSHGSSNGIGGGGGKQQINNASPRLLSSTVHTFPYDAKTLRSCGELPLGIIVTPLGCLNSLCCSSLLVSGGRTNNNDDDDAATRLITNTTTTSTQWNGREQGDIYSENRTDVHTSRDVDYVISPFDGNGVMMRGSSNTTTNNNNKEGDENDPECIPVIRGPKRSIVVDDNIHSLSSPSKRKSTTTTGSSSTTTRMKTTRTITPPRCNRCNAYLNPYCTPSSSNSHSTTSSLLTNTFQGLIYTPTQSYNCNMCGSKSSILITNEEYIANNIFEMTSLSYGTVEYEVGGEYEVREGGAVQNVFLYGVEYAPSDVVIGGVGGGIGVNQQQQQHHHHGTMKSHGWKESLDAIRNVARELCITAPRREVEDGVVRKDVKIGIFAFCQDMLVFPYIKRKGHLVHNGEEDDDEEEELAVAIVSDVTDEPFCPLPLKSWSYNVGEGLESKEWHRFCRVLDSFTELMEQLLVVGESPQHQQDDRWRRNCGGAALVALGDALKESGGRGTLITSRRPNYGVGALRDREAVSKYGIGSSSEQKLFTPLQQLVQRNNDAVGIVKDKPAGLFYKKLGEECAKNRVCLDIVVTSSSVSVPSTDPKQLQQNPNMREFLDVATLGELCRVTCGHFKWLRVGNECGVAVNGSSDSFTGEQLREELKRSALAYTGSDVVFKLRCSTGVQVKSYSPTLPVGNLIGDGIVNSAELELSSMHPGTSIAVVLEHKIGGVVDTMSGGSSRKGIDMPMVFFQSAVLYTTKTGQRRVRVSTLGLPTSKVPADIFRSADLGAVSTMLTRGAISDVERDGGSLRLARENVFNKCVSILANYRSHTTARTSPSGQLILPESLQLLPLFCLSLRKSRMLRHSLPKGISSAKPFPTADERAYHIFYGRMVSPNMSLQCVHPHLFQVSDMRTRDGDWITPPVLQENKFDDANVIAASMRPVCQLPKTMNPSIACLDESGMYLLDDRFSFYLFIGKDVPGEKWRDLLSVGGVGSSRARGSTIPIGGLSLADTDSAHKLRSVIHQLRMLNSPNETLGLTARNTYAPLILVFVGRGSVFEEEMDSLLVDDPDSHERSYVDFLCDIHRSVREKWDQT